MMTRHTPSVAAPMPSLTQAPVRSTGLASLDQRLPGGGWPRGGRSLRWQVRIAPEVRELFEHV